MEVEVPAAVVVVRAVEVDVARVAAKDRVAAKKAVVIREVVKGRVVAVVVGAFKIRVAAALVSVENVFAPVAGQQRRTKWAHPAIVYSALSVARR